MNVSHIGETNMKRKKNLFLPTALHSFLLYSIGNLLFLILVGIITIGCGVDFDREEDAEPPVIKTLTVETSVINIQGIATVTAVVPLNEDRDLQYEYRWSASEGEIKHNGVWDTHRMPETHSQKIIDSTEKGKQKKKIDNAQSLTAMATYIPPKKPGIYTITLKVCTRYAVVEKSENVEVTDFIIETSPRVYWESDGGEQSFTYSFNVEAIRRAPILLRYEIQQDLCLPGASLKIKIDEDQIPLVDIEKPTLITHELIVKGVDITKYIKSPKKYKLTLTLIPKENINKKKWLLKKIQIVGVEGNFLL